MNRAGRHSLEKTASGSGREEREACLQEQVGRVWASYESPLCSPIPNPCATWGALWWRTQAGLLWYFQEVGEIKNHINDEFSRQFFLETAPFHSKLWALSFVHLCAGSLSLWGLGSCDIAAANGRCGRILFSGSLSQQTCWQQGWLQDLPSFRNVHSLFSYV